VAAMMDLRVRFSLQSAVAVAVARVGLGARALKGSGVNLI